jgi:hypothetical protein
MFSASHALPSVVFKWLCDLLRVSLSLILKKSASPRANGAPKARQKLWQSSQTKKGTKLLNLSDKVKILDLC